MKDRSKTKAQRADDLTGAHQRTTASKAAETEISADIKKILDVLPFYVLLIDADHHIIWANKAVGSDLGLDPKDILGCYCPKIVHGLDEPFPGCPLEEAVKTGCAETRQLFDVKSGRWMEAEVYPTRRRTKDGRAIFLHMTNDITQQKLAEEQIRRNYGIQVVLNSLLQLSLEDLALEALLKGAFDLIISLSWLTLESRGSIFLVEDNPSVLVMNAQSGLAGPVQKACAKVPFGKCLCGRAALTQEVQFADRVDERHEVKYKGMTPHGHYCVPILYAGKTLGVINTYLKEGHLRDQKEEEFLVAVANTLAGIIVRKRTEGELSRSYKRLQKTLDGTVHALASTVEKRDPYTAGHQLRVSHLACAIAREMGLDAEKIEGIRIAGIVHDIGKICVPAEILSKPGKLTDIEFGIVKTHVQASYDILSTVDFPWPVAQIAFQHHERLDGSGYPSGLKGKDILLEARIMAVADVVEAMSSHRPYRSALGAGQALEEIMHNEGKLYDPEVVAACVSLFHEKGFKLDEA